MGSFAGWLESQVEFVVAGHRTPWLARSAGDPSAHLGMVLEQPIASAAAVHVDGVGLHPEPLADLFRAELLQHAEMHHVTWPLPGDRGDRLLDGVGLVDLLDLVAVGLLGGPLDRVGVRRLAAPALRLA